MLWQGSVHRARQALQRHTHFQEKIFFSSNFIYTTLIYLHALLRTSEGLTSSGCGGPLEQVQNFKFRLGNVIPNPCLHHLHNSFLNTSSPTGWVFLLHQALGRLREWRHHLPVGHLGRVCLLKVLFDLIYTLFLTTLLTNFLAIAQKSQKWVQMQRKRYGEKRKGGYVDMGKQVRLLALL